MPDTHDHHQHMHHMNHEENMINSTPSPETFTTLPTVASTLFQAILTTVMSPDHDHHNMSSHDYPPLQDAGEVHRHVSSHANHHAIHLASSDNSSNGHNMMYFHSGVDVTILFKEWSVSTSHGLIGSVVGIFLMALMYEGIKFYREHLFKRYFTSLEYSSVAVVGDNGKTVREVHKVVRNRMLSWPHFIQTALHVIQMVLSYFLMLIFMTYNVWLCLGVVLGAGAGYFLFGWKKAIVVDITEHCH